MTSLREPSELRLRPLRNDDEADVRAANLELAPDGFDFALGLGPEDDWALFLQSKVDGHAGINLVANIVPASFLIAEVDGQVTARVSVRHELNDWLRNEGGHIGYGVRPAFRRRGIATEVLRQSLIVARAHGVDRVLVTCDDDNVGSATVIERCGGHLDPLQPMSTGSGTPKRRYWIE